MQPVRREKDEWSDTHRETKISNVEREDLVVYCFLTQMDHAIQVILSSIFFHLTI